MIWRFLEAFFRHKLLLLTPPILIPLLVTPLAFAMVQPEYASGAGIWVERPTYVSYQDDWNRYITPAQNQAGRLREALNTRIFAADVARRSGLITAVADAEDLNDFFAKNIRVLSTSEHMVNLVVRASDPQLAFRVVTTIMQAFREKVATERINQAQLATSFYESGFQQAQEELGKAQAALRRYIASNPRLANLDPRTPDLPAGVASLPLSVTDPQLAELLARVEIQQKDVDRLRAALQGARQNSSASMEALDLSFQIVDPPGIPSSASREKKKLLIYPAVALAVGLLISTVVLVLLVAGDRTVREEADFGAQPAVPVVGALPRLRLKRVPRRSGPQVTRLALGYIAGAALPAPKGGK